jgi:hypothetical protein
MNISSKDKLWKARICLGGVGCKLLSSMIFWDLFNLMFTSLLCIIQKHQISICPVSFCNSWIWWTITNATLLLIFVGNQTRRSVTFRINLRLGRSRFNSIYSVQLQGFTMQRYHAVKAHGGFLNCHLPCLFYGYKGTFISCLWCICRFLVCLYKVFIAKPDLCY